MAVHSGLEGIVRVGGTPATVAELTEWTLETSGETTDSTSINTATANGGWRTHVATLKGWSGSVKCFWDETDTNGQQTIDAGLSVDFKFYPEGNTTGDVFFSGTGIVTAVNRSAKVDGLVEVEFSFTGTGALTEGTV